MKSDSTFTGDVSAESVKPRPVQINGCESVSHVVYVN